MSKLTRYTLGGILFTLITGILLHFAYEWSGNHRVVGLFSATNESTWEHMKLVFFLLLIYSFYMNSKLKNTYPCVTSALLAGILLGTLLIPVIFYTYSGILGKNTALLNIGTFVCSVILSFFLIYRSIITCHMEKFYEILEVLVVAFFMGFLLFTYYPPSLGIFISPNN